MRKPLTLLGMAALLLLAATLALPATATSASIGSATSSTCDTVAIIIDTDETVGIGSATFTVVYDTSKVSLNSVANGALGTVTWDDVSGTVKMTATDAQTCPTGNGITFADLEFCPVTGASGCSDLNLGVISIYGCDVISIMPDSVNDGKFCIEGPNDPPTVSGGSVIVPRATPTGTDAQPISGNATPTTSISEITETNTPVTTSTKKLATKPETKGLPGFEVMFAIAGLLAVAYMLLRR